MTFCCVLLISSIAAVHDFTLFEDEVLPAWLDLFTVAHDAGKFSYQPKTSSQPRPAPSLYGSADVIHVLATTGMLSALNATTRDAWAAQVDSYQNADGFYNHSTSNSRYHAIGEATASLALLDRRPRYNCSEYEAFAEAGPDAWSALYTQLYFNNGTGVRPNRTGCGSSIHSCGQIIGSFPSVLAYTTGSKHAPFVRWWSRWLANMTSAATGTLCPLNATRGDLFDSLGGGMATHGIQLGIAAGAPHDYPFELAAPRALLTFALALQNRSSGAWVKPRDDGTHPAPLGSMTLDGIFQATRASEQVARHGGNASAAAVRAACDLLLETSARQLANRSWTLGQYANDSHGLPNVLAAVGECARAFPRLVKTRRPWTCCARYV
jgi:hypothetical protein